MSKEFIVNTRQTTLDQLELPPTVYKYRTWEDTYHKRFITEKEVFLASPNTFEDQLDCHNPTRFDLLKDNQIYEYYFLDSKRINSKFTRQQHREFARSHTKRAPFKNKFRLAEWQNHFDEQYFKRTGILSLTENWNNDKMWEKYADNGNGICIGYKTSELFKYLGGGGPVHYMDKLPIIYPLPFTSDEAALFQRVYCKTSQWSFEEEYRTKMYWNFEASTEDRRIILPTNCFQTIILGDNLSAEAIHEIKDAVSASIGEIEVISRKDYITKV
ncbi:DUF2971 domain-containing protein [Sphingobacterium paludis]|uniref:DUF2971 domain-containing protein n=1 Tax=Sphingobacterium paludis TaxID=1476465 RepID=A0A4V3E0W1_9SPHI|nr:DUF2971 domain-containing protein [Sphingobacterium paludis]TDS07593.1 Protein of unknown function (DUF2971) [Sphingobacterium paludis]